MKNWRNCKITSDKTLVETLQVIDKSALKTALVVDEEDRLIGIITDGDIRRAILKGLPFSATAKEFMTNKPLTATVNHGKSYMINLMRKYNIDQLPVLDEDKHLVNLYRLEELLYRKQRDNLVLLMAGGLGMRLRPLTENIPKPLLKVGNKPILETILENFISAGFYKFYIAVNYKKEMIENYFGNGVNYGVEINYIHEKKRMGTAGALYFLPRDLTEPVIVMNGDLLTNVDFGGLVDYHTNQNVSATMGVREYSYQVPYGVIDFDGDTIKKITEKPQLDFYVNAGIYVLSSETVLSVDKEIYLDMPDLFNNLIENKKKTTIYPIRDYWMDIGHMEEFQQAQTDYQNIFEKGLSQLPPPHLRTVASRSVMVIFMYKDKKILAVIPARGGSKGIPRKNIKPLAGKPLIAWTIEEANKSGYVDTCIVSTEDEEIKKVAEDCGGYVPFLRPAELAQDKTSSVDVILNVLEKFSDHDYVVLLQPTSPLRLVADIDGAIDFCIKQNAESVVSVTTVVHSPYWMYTLNGKKELEPILKISEDKFYQRQSLPQIYQLNGAVYAAKTEFIKKNLGFIDSKTLGYVMPQERSLDIDTTIDFEMTEFFLTHRRRGALEDAKI